MGNSFQGSQRQSDAGNTAGLSQLFGQMMTMPFSAFDYSIQILMQLLQGAMQMTNEGVNAVAGGAAQTLGGMPGTVGATFNGAGNTQQNNRKEEQNMSEQSWGGGQVGTGSVGQSWGGGESGWNVSDDCRDTEACDRLRLVRFKILFLKRDLEVAFPEQEELVTEEMPKEGFISWKIAEFIQQMGRGEVAQPGKWKEKNYPPEVTGGNVMSLPDKDKRFLRVYAQVLAWYDRERVNHERDQVDVLKEIRDVLQKKV